MSQAHDKLKYVYCICVCVGCNSKKMPTKQQKETTRVLLCQIPRKWNSHYSHFKTATMGLEVLNITKTRNSEPRLNILHSISKQISMLVS